MAGSNDFDYVQLMQTPDGKLIMFKEQNGQMVVSHEVKQLIDLTELVS